MEDTSKRRLVLLLFVQLVLRSAQNVRLHPDPPPGLTSDFRFLIVPLLFPSFGAGKFGAIPLKVPSELISYDRLSPVDCCVCNSLKQVIRPSKSQCLERVLPTFALRQCQSYPWLAALRYPFSSHQLKCSVENQFDTLNTAMKEA